MYFDFDSADIIQISYAEDVAASQSDSNSQATLETNRAVHADVVDATFRDGTPTFTVIDFASVPGDQYSFFSDDSVARGYCDAINIGALSINHDDIMGRIDIVPASSTHTTTNLVQPLFSFAPGSHPLCGQKVEPPLLPYAPMNTMFSSSRPLEETVSLLGAVFREADAHLAVTHVPHEFSWQCSFLSGATFVNFNVRIYRYQKAHALHGQFAVEFQRIEGDRIPFINIYNAARDLLTSSASAPEDIQDFMINRCHNGVFVPCAPVINCFESFQLPSVTVSAASSATNNAPHSSAGGASVSSTAQTIAEMKSVILTHLSNPRTYACLLETVQMISSLYSSLADLQQPGSLLPSEQDVSIFRALCSAASHYSSNPADWVYKHSIIAVADMLAHFESSSSSSPSSSSLLRSSSADQEGVLCMLRKMAGAQDPNPFLATKTEVIARLVLAM